MKGNRPIRLKDAAFLSKGCELTPAESLYFRALIQLEQASTLEEKDLCQIWLKDLHPGKEFRTREIDEFHAVSHWLYTALWALCETRLWDGNAKTAWKSLTALGHTLTLNEVEQAMERLVALDLLRADPSGVLRPTLEQWTSRNDIANAGVQRYHAESSKLASQSIERTGLDEREFQSFSISLQREHLPRAKEMIRKFRHQFISAFGQDAGDDVYQVNLQFFRLTDIARALPDFAARSDARPASHSTLHGESVQ
jgi:uncharacterized protein (TIGR02147 family)